MRRFRSFPPPQTAHGVALEDEDTDEEDTADDVDATDGEEDGGSDAILSKPLAIFLGRLSKLRQSGLLTAVPFSINETAAATANPATTAAFRAYHRQR